MTSNEIIKKARTKMIARMPFFGLLAVYLAPVEGGTNTMATDGEHLYYLSSWVEKVLQEDGIEAVMGGVAHEVMHCALQHLWRRKGRDALLWNVACDYAINAILRRAGFALPKGALYEASFEGMTAEEIYNCLKKELPFVVPQAWGSHEYWKDDGSGDNSGDSPQKTEEGEDGGKSAKAADEDGPKKGRAAGDAAGEASEKRSEVWKARLAETYQRAQSHGFTPKGLERMVEDALKPDIPWEAILSDFMERSQHEYGWLPPDRRLIWNDIYVPNLSDAETVPEGIIAIDSSGSISDSLLQKFLANIKAAAAYIAKLHIVVCDAQVWLWETVEMTDGKPFPQIHIRGGGGTDFRPVFDEIRKRGMQPQFLVYLTDGYGTYPDNPPDYPVLWLSTGAEPPWGQYVPIPD